jgi:hypothetical protein
MGKGNGLPQKQFTGCYSKRHKLYLPLSYRQHQLPIQQEVYDGLCSSLHMTVKKKIPSTPNSKVYVQNVKQDK